MEVAFVLDTTGSMSGMIAGAKRKVWFIASRLMSAQPKPEIHFALVAYRDRGDQYVTQVCPLDADLDAVSARLQALQANGGGDGPESVNEALHTAITKLEWSDDPQVLRVVFLVGDAPPHMDYPRDVLYPETCAIARAKDILVNTLQCDSWAETATAWREIAALTGGSYSAIMQNGGSIAIETPHDREIAEITARLEATIVPYGTKAERELVRRHGDRMRGLSAEGVADRSAFLGKSDYGAAISGKGDLIVEILNDRLQYGAIDPDKLDPDLRAMPVAGRNALIRRKVDERHALIVQLEALVEKRETAVAARLASVKGEDGVLELSAFEVIATEAGEKGFRFDTGTHP
jgi:hypothetical protein